MSDSHQSAMDRFSGPFSCSQAIFSSYASEFGLSEELAIKLASPFGGGMARQGQVCGAVSGALMAIGLAYGSALPSDKEKVYRVTQEFMQRFEVRHGSVMCRELIGFDLRDPEELQAANDQKIDTTVCPGFVSTAAEILDGLLPSEQVP